MEAKSFWLTDEGLLNDLRFKTSSTPNHCDFLIVGGGLSGISCLYWLSDVLSKSCEQSQKPSILLIESGAISSGAVGKNGGHLFPVNEFEILCASELVEVITKYNLQEEVELFLTDGTFPAQVFPSKLIRGLLNISRRVYEKITISTHTTATNISLRQNSIDVLTNKGVIQCGKVFITTNAYTPKLLKEFENIIIPTRGQCLATNPLPKIIFPKNHIVEYPDGSGIYLIQRKPDKRIIVGGFRAIVEGKEVNQLDDSVINPQITQRFIEWFNTEKPFKQLDEPPKIEYQWTGIMGFTIDCKPIVGKLPQDERSRVFISAGFNGHGMPVCFWSSKYIVFEALGIPRNPLVHSYLSQFSPLRFFQPSCL